VDFFFGVQQVVRSFFCFLGFYFVRLGVLGWFVVCVDVALFFARNLHYEQNSIKN